MELTSQMERLFQRRRFGIKPGLESEQLLLDALEHPERSFATVHVAGTNGKGSVCAMVASVLETAGYRTGLFTSPHLVKLNERFCVNGAMIDDGGLKHLMERVEAAAVAVEAESDRTVTFFECCAAMAFDHFRASGVQLAVVETGMGGRLDATNVLEPAVTVITRIDLDHTAYLGDDYGTIAAEKAGIIKPGRPVVIGAMPPEARTVIAQVAADRGAALRDASETVGVDVLAVGIEGQRVKVSTGSDSYAPLCLPLLGAHQVENLAVAVATVEVLRDQVGLPCSDAALSAGIAATQWEGRLQVLQREPPLILDGAHNPGAARVLIQSLKQVFKGRPVGMVLGMCSDKQIGGTLHELAVLAPRIWTVPLSNERGLPSADLQQLARAAGLQAIACENLPRAIADALAWAGENDGVVCIAGSLFLAGDVLKSRKGDTHVLASD